MKIAIISDTHGNAANFKKAVAWINKNNIKTILHCGDIGSPEFLQESLENFKGNFFGVLGNADHGVAAKEYNKIPNVKVQENSAEIEIGSKKIFFTHFLDDAKQAARTEKYDIVFYGHTHRPWEQTLGNCRVACPGELAGQLYKPSFAVFDAKADSLKLKILDNLE